MTWTMFQLIPGVTRSLRVRIVIDGREIVDDFLIGLHIDNPQPGEDWRAHVELCESRPLWSVLRIRRTWLGRLLALARGRR